MSDINPDILRRQSAHLALDQEVRKLFHAIHLTDAEWYARVRTIAELAEKYSLPEPFARPVGKVFNVTIDGMLVHQVLEASAGKNGWVAIHKRNADGDLMLIGNEFVRDVLRGNVVITEIKQ